MCRRILLLFIFFQSLFSQPPHDELYAFDYLFNKNTYHLSPLRGSIALTWLKNLYNLGNKDHSTIQLLHLLFNVLEYVELKVTSHEPYNHFTFQTIVELVQALENNTIHEKINDDFALISQIRRSFKGNKCPQRLRHMIEIILNAQQESKQGIYPSHMVKHILLAFLFLKTEKTKDLRKYASTFKKQSPQSQAFRTKKWTEEGFQRYQAWCSTVQQDQNLNDTSYNFIDDFEELLYCTHMENRILEVPSPLVYDYIDVPYRKKIADCCESTLKYFCLLICYDKEKKKIDLTRIPEDLQINMPDYFQNHLNRCNVNSVKEINDKKIREEWFSLISNLNQAQYRRQTKDRKKYEIHPSVNNFITILYHIFGINFCSDAICESAIQNDWNELCSCLSKKSNFDISCINTTYHSDISNTATFLLKENKKDTKNIIFTLHIRPEHSWIAIDTQNDFKPFIIENGERIFTQKNMLIKNLCAAYRENATLQLRDLLHLYARYIDIAQLPIKNAQDTLLFSHPTENDEQRLRLCKRLLQNIHNQNSPVISNVLELLKTFDQPFFISEALCGLLRKRVHMNEQIISYLLTNAHSSDQWVRVKIFITLVQLKAWKIEGYDEFLCKMFDELPEYEKEFNLKIDIKRHALLQLFNYQAHENQHMKKLILNALNIFKEDRAEKILNQLKYSLTSDAHQQNIFTR